MAYGFGGGFAEGLRGGAETVGKLQDASARRGLLVQEQSQQMIQDVTTQVDANLKTLAEIVGSKGSGDEAAIETIKGQYSQALMQTIGQLAQLPGGAQPAQLLAQKVQTTIPSMKTAAQQYEDSIKSKVEGAAAIVGYPQQAVQNNQQQVAQNVPGTVPAGGFASEKLPETPLTPTEPGSQVAAGPAMPGAQAAPAPLPTAGAAEPAMRNVAPPQPEFDEYGLPIEQQQTEGLIQVGQHQVTPTQYKSLISGALGFTDPATDLKSSIAKDDAKELLESNRGLIQAVNGAAKMQALAKDGIITGPGSAIEKGKIYSLMVAGQATPEQIRKYENTKLYDAAAIGLAAARLKAFGSGSAVSDRDVEYALLQVGGSSELTAEAIAALTGGLIQESLEGISANNAELKRYGLSDMMRKLPKVGRPTGEARLEAIPDPVFQDVKAFLRSKGENLTQEDVETAAKMVRDAVGQDGFNKVNQKFTEAEAGEQKANAPSAETHEQVLYEGKRYWVPKSGTSDSR